MATYEDALRIARIYVAPQDKEMGVKGASADIVGSLKVSDETVVIAIHYVMCS